MKIMKISEIFTKNNRYSYKLDLNNPTIRKLYDKYKEKNNLPRNYPLSDLQRKDFETKVINYFKAKGTEVR